MRRIFTTIACVFVFCVLLVHPAHSQFAGLFAIPNWTNVNTNSNGTTITSGAPANIQQVSSNGLSGAGWTDFLINVVQSGTITFDWAYTTVDGPTYDYPRNLLNGVATVPTGFGVGQNQNGTQTPIVVCAGDVFGFRVHSTDNVAGSCTVTITNFSFTGAPAMNVVTAPTVVACSDQSVSMVATGAVQYTWAPGNFVGATYSIPSPTANAIYTVTGGDGCSVGTATTELIPATSPTVMAAGASTMCQFQQVNLSAAGADTYSWSNGGNTASVTVSPNTTTNYTVVGTTTAGCSDADTVSVYVLQSPTMAISGLSVACATTPFTLTASGANTYSWSVGAAAPTIAVSPTVSTVYTVTGSHTVNACQTVISKSVTINPLPIMSTTGTGLICSGMSKTLTACCADAYYWSHGGTTGTVVVSPTVNTTYTVIGVTAAGCTKSVTATVFVSICQGLNELAGNEEVIRAYPNPFQSQFTVELNAAATISVYNTIGKSVLEQTLVSGENLISLENYPAGVYFISVKTENKLHTAKIIKQ